MVRLGLVLVLAVVSSMVRADALPTFGIDDAYDEGTNPDKRPFQKGRLRSVTVQFDGKHPGASKPVLDGCEGFVPNVAMVREYFRKSRQVSAQAYKHDEVWSHCEATGTFSFKDGRSGQWRIQQYGLGVLLIGSQKIYLHCEGCKLNGLGAAN
jgi:hypothetical protein